MPDRLAERASWVLAGMVGLVIIAWTNFTATGLTSAPLLYDDVALLRLVITLVGVGISWTLLAVSLRRGDGLAWNWTWVALAGLAVWASVSGVAADTSLVWLGHSERLEGVVTVWLYAALFGAGLQVGRSPHLVRRIAIGLVSGATVVAAHGLLQFARLDPTDYSIAGATYFLGSAFANLGNPNFLAAVLVLALPLAVAFALQSSRGLTRWVCWVAVAVIALALYATYSQGAWLAVVVQGALAAGLWVSLRRLTAARGTSGTGSHASRRAVVLVIAIVVVGVALIVGASAVAADRGLRLWGSALPDTIESRLWLAESARDMLGDHPLTGVGPDNFLEGFRVHRPEGYASVYGLASTSNNAHSWPLQYAATFGIPGAVMLTAALALGLIAGCPHATRVRDAEQGIMAMAVWIAAIGFVVQMMFNVAMLASTVPFWLLLGIASSGRVKLAQVPRSFANAMIGMCAVILAIAVPVSAALLMADAAFMSSRRAYHSVGGEEQAVSLAEKASRLNPLSVKYARAVAQSRSAILFAALAEEGVSEDRIRALYGDAGKAFDAVLRLSPDDYAAHAWRAALDVATGTAIGDAELLQDARESTERAAALDLHHDEILGLLAGDYSALSVLSARTVPALP